MGSSPQKYKKFNERWTETSSCLLQRDDQEGTGLQHTNSGLESSSPLYNSYLSGWHLQLRSLPSDNKSPFFPSCCTEIVADLFPRRVMGTQLGQPQHELHVGALEGATSELQQYWGWIWFLEFQIRVRLALFWSITTTIPNHFIIFFFFLTLEEILASARTNASQVERAGILKKSLVSLIGDSYKEHWKVPETLLVPPKECKLSRYDRWTPLHLPIPHPPEVLAAQASREFSNENIRKGQVIRTETLWRITLPSEYFHARINWGATFPERDPNKAETEIRDLKSLLQYTLKD